MTKQNKTIKQRVKSVDKDVEQLRPSGTVAGNRNVVALWKKNALIPQKVTYGVTICLSNCILYMGGFYCIWTVPP